MSGFMSGVPAETGVNIRSAGRHGPGASEVNMVPETDSWTGIGRGGWFGTHRFSPGGLACYSGARVVDR